MTIDPKFLAQHMTPEQLSDERELYDLTLKRVAGTVRVAPVGDEDDRGSCSWFYRFHCIEYREGYVYDRWEVRLRYRDPVEVPYGGRTILKRSYVQTFETLREAKAAIDANIAEVGPLQKSDPA